MEESIVNAFGYVTKVYEETSYLFKDFNEVLAQHGFTSIMGNSIGTTYVSRDINSPRYWLTRYLSLFYKPVDQESDSPLLAITATFYDLKPEPVPPVLILGFASGMDHPKRTWNYWWFFSAFFNEDGVVEYFINKNGELVPFKGPPSSDNSVIYFKNLLESDRYQWFKKGCMFAVPLLEVNDYKTIQELSEKIVQLWEENFENGDVV